MLDRIDVAFLPAEAALFDAATFIVVDLFRATTNIATLFAAGVTRLTAAATIEDARALAAARRALLCGEVGGLAPAGFDLGNSPVEARTAAVAGREAVLFTTNGSRALCAVAGRGEVIAGAFANLTAVAEFVAAREGHVVLVCAGDAGGRRFSLDDCVGAGAFVRAFTALAPGAALGDAARLAARTSIDDARGSHHAGLLRDLGLGADVDFALLRDTSRAVPLVSSAGAGWAALKNASIG